MAALPTQGRHRVVLDPAMIRALLGRKEEDVEYDAFKYKFKPSSILSSKPGTLTPSKESSPNGTAIVHLQGPLPGEVHGFSAKVESEGMNGTGQNDHLAVLDWDGDKFTLLPVSKTYSLVHDKSLARDTLPNAPSPPPPISTATATAPPRVDQDVHMSSSPSSKSSPPVDRPIETKPSPPVALPPRPPSLPSTSRRPPSNPDVEILSFPSSSSSTTTYPPPPPTVPSRPTYGGKTLTHFPSSASSLPPQIVHTNESSEEDESSESEGDDDDDFAAQLKQELAGMEGEKKAGKGGVGGKGMGLGLGAGKRPVSLNSLMGVEDDESDQESASSDE